MIEVAEPIASPLLLTRVRVDVQREVIQHMGDDLRHRRLIDRWVRHVSVQLSQQVVTRAAHRDAERYAAPS